jgi:hypothetical protein
MIVNNLSGFLGRMKMMRWSKVTAMGLLGAVAISLSTSAAWADPPPAPPLSLIDKPVLDQISGVLANPVVPLMINAQNQLRAGITQAQIDTLDKSWVAERKQDKQPLIARTLSNPLSSYLLQTQAGSLGLFHEIFIVDNNGLNVGQSDITSDYWQGDEAKFQKTYPLGPGTVFIDEPEYDEDSKIWFVQVDLTLTDPATQKAIGAAVFEINLTELARRRSV